MLAGPPNSIVARSSCPHDSGPELESRDRWGRASRYDETSEIGANSHAGLPGKRPFQEALQQEERGEMGESTTKVRLPGAARRFGHVCAFFHNGGFLHENPFFVPHDEFLRELRARDGSTPQS
jgi:hypothetical protein